jgi:hypothetical protein
MTVRLRVLMAMLVLVAASAPAWGRPAKHAAGAARKATAAPSAAEAASSPALRPPPAAARPAPAGVKGTPKQLLARIAQLYDALEYDQIPPLAEAVLAADDATADEHLEARRFLGSALAIVADPVDAEPAFRLLLREKADFDLPDSTPPKIISVFRKVQAEEKALSTQLQAAQRARLAQSIRVLGDPPRTGQGGLPVHFSFRVRDVGGAVEVVRVPYRRAGQPTFSALALERTDDGAWKGQLPGDFTASPSGFSLQYFVEAADSVGRLAGVGTEVSPLVLVVSAGQVPTARVRLPRWVAYLAGGLTLGLGAAGGSFGLLTSNTQRRYDSLTAGLTASGAEVVALQRQGTTYATATNATLISAGGAALITLVLLPFVEW